MPPKKVAINGQKCAEGDRLPGPPITSLLVYTHSYTHTSRRTRYAYGEVR